MSRRPRVAAVDPLANVQKPAAAAGPSTQDPLASSTTKNAGSTTPSALQSQSSQASQNQSQQQQQQQLQPSQQYRPPPPPPASTSSSSALFDPMFKHSAKAHRGAQFASFAPSKPPQPQQQQQKQDHSFVSTIATTTAKPEAALLTDINASFDKSETTFKEERERLEEKKWKLENESKMLSAPEIIDQWKNGAATTTASSTMVKMEPHLQQQQQQQQEARPDFVGAAGKTMMGPSSFVQTRKELISPSTCHNTMMMKQETDLSTSQDAAATTTTTQTSQSSSSSSHQQIFPPTTNSSSNKQQSRRHLNKSGIPFLLDDIPEVEWWDRPFLAAPSYALGAACTKPGAELPPLGRGPFPSSSSASSAITTSSSATSALSSSKPHVVVSLRDSVAAAAAAAPSSQSQDAAKNPATTTKEQNVHHHLPLATITSHPRKIGWNPQESETAEMARLQTAHDSAMSVKTPQELKKERHARKVEAAKEREDQARHARALSHNFGFARSIAVDGGGDGAGGTTSSSSSNAQQQQQQQPHDRLKIKHLKTSLLGDVALDPSIGDKVRELQLARLVAAREADMKRHVDAKPNQLNHEFDVKKRHAMTAPKMIAVRCLGVTDERAVNRLKLECKEMFLRGALLWIDRRFLVGVLIGGVKAVAKAEALFLRRAVYHKDLLKIGTNMDVVWGGTVSDFAFLRTFLFDQSPFDRSGNFKKPPSSSVDVVASSAVVNKEEEKQQQQQQPQEDFRGKYESVPIVKCDCCESAKQWFLKNGMDFVWDAIACSPVVE